MKKLSFSFSLIILLLLLFTLLFKSQFYRISKQESLEEPLKTRLAELAEKSLESSDVPVAAIIIYNDKIIGTGFNTIFLNKNAGEHAEINAISDAIKKTGFSLFNNLNRDSLFLISTFEPCPMCIGAIQLYKIKHVKFLKEKPVTDWLRNEAGDFFYEINKRKINAGELQDSLFRLHPGFKNN